MIMTTFMLIIILIPESGRILLEKKIIEQFSDDKGKELLLNGIKKYIYRFVNHNLFKCISGKQNGLAYANKLM